MNPYGTMNASTVAGHARGHRPALMTLMAAAILCAGCAGWAPWKNQELSARNRERYGPTANQRIKELEAEAKEAKAGTADRQAVFTQELIRKMLEEHDPRVRCAILGAANEFSTPAALAICRGSLDDPNERVRTRACEEWRKRGGEEAVQLLAARYRTDPELDVRLRALRMLGDLKEQSAIPVLAKALEDPDPAVQYRAVSALKKVSGRDLGDDVNKWREWAADPNGTSADWSIAETFRKLF